jgi:putative transposase
MDTRKIASEYRLAQWSQAMRERADSGESIRSFCQNRGVSKNTYFYWQKKLRSVACERLAKLQEKPTGIAAHSFTEVKMLESPNQSLAEETGQLLIEVRGVKITTDSTYPADKLATLLRELVC